ncbi:hypothetical protein HHX47_DHR5001082 [Lentinula edodes]|nr:hypothetical protein HHX47_DHR5001082 [Lentinula edodes]
MKRFTESVENITGQPLDVRAISEDTQMNSAIVKEEVAQLRKQVEELSQERTALQKEKDEQLVEINTYKSLPVASTSQTKIGGKVAPEVQGFVQRVIAKEKEVRKLQSELDHLKSRLPSEALVELTANSKVKDQHIQYLKRALEAVWSRFKSREEERDTAEIDPEQMAARSIQTPPPPPPPPTPVSGRGPPPPPPPPPTAFRMPARKPSKPVKRLKPFFWTKLASSALESSIWQETTSESQFDLTDLEATFAIDNTPGAGTGTASQIPLSPSKKQAVTTLLDITRANNIAIMLSRIKLKLPEIREALLKLDDEKLSTDDLRAISKQLPTSDEVMRIQDFNDVSKLAIADQYFAEAVLAVGNALNGSSFRGGARGFQLDALMKRLLLEVGPINVASLEFTIDKNYVASVQTTVQAVNSLVTGLNQVKNETSELKRLRDIRPNDHPGVEALKTMAVTVEAGLRSLLAYYGENPDSPEAPKSEDFFGLILSFSSSLQKCSLEVHECQRKLETSLPKPEIVVVSGEETTIKLQAPVPLLTPGSQSSMGKSVGRGDLDQAIRSMRDGKRRARPTAARPLSKIFLDGAPAGGRPLSRLFDS